MAWFGGLSFAVVATSILSAYADPVEKSAGASKLPTMGEKAPEFTLNDLQGQPTSLSELTGKSKVVLVVLRGYPGYQCPICSIQVGSLISKAKDLSDAGARVVFVYPGPADNLTGLAEEFIKGKKLPDHFVFLTDPAYKFTDAWELRWDAPRETAYPSTFVIDRQGIVRFAKISKTHGDRANPVDILKALSTAD
ncbi:MAG: peroxiredoxin family protein [Pirellulales bacterium]